MKGINAKIFKWELGVSYSAKSYTTVPEHQVNPICQRPEKLLLICFYNSKESGFIAERIASIQRCSCFSITVLNLFEHQSFSNFLLQDALNLNYYSGIIVHSTVAPQSINQLAKNIKYFLGLKIAIKNDLATQAKYIDYDWVYTEKRWDNLEIENFDKQLLQLLQRQQLVEPPLCSTELASKNILLLAAHEPVKDPRLAWIVNAVPESITVLQLGIDMVQNASVLIDKNKTHYRQTWSAALDDNLLIQAGKSAVGRDAVYELREIQRMLTLPEEEFCEQYGSSYGNHRKTDFRWYLRYVLSSTALLLQQAVRIRGLHGIIATDLPTLPAALILKALFNIPVFYDAHEYWPEVDIACAEFETEFWMGMEQRLLGGTDYRQTVSSCLAEFMSKKYGLLFNSVPNCIPRSEIPLISELKKIQLVDSSSTSENCRFLFQGNFALGRGVDLLINLWPETDERAILLLRGPDVAYKNELLQLAEKTGLLGRRIQFLPAVDEAKLVDALADGDVGLIPYCPILANYSNCCPNKLSQYLAAKLPILANNTQFVTEIIESSHCGKVVDFTDKQAVIASITLFLNDKEARRTMGKRGYEFFCEKFHWEKVSGSFYQMLDQLTSGTPPTSLTVFAQPNTQSMYQRAKLSGLTRMIIRLVRLFTPIPIIAQLKKHAPNVLIRKARLYWE